MKSKIERLGKVSITVEKNYWDKNKAYNRLTIVERQGTRTAYLSRKVVPIGVDITDRNYWITISKWADVPVVQELGDSTELVISQKVVTLKINELQELIDDINEIIGEGSSIDERIATAKLEVKSDIIDGASENTNTFKKVEDALDARYTKEETYSKEELNNLITTPDEEDLTSVNVGGTNVLKFRDKAYTPLIYSGMGRKILRKNIVNDINTLTQSMINQSNTIYVIQYDFTLSENITVPADCVLEFDGGSISGHSLTVSSGCNIYNRIGNPVFSDIIIKSSDEYRTSWFDSISSFSQSVIYGNEGCIVHIDSDITITSVIVIPQNSFVIGENNCKINIVGQFDGLKIANGATYKNLVFYGQGSPTDREAGYAEHAMAGTASNVLIENCKFYNFYAMSPWVIYFRADNDTSKVYKNIVIKNCIFDGIGSYGNGVIGDATGSAEFIAINNSYEDILIENNIFKNCYGSEDTYGLNISKYNISNNGFPNSTINEGQCGYANLIIKNNTFINNATRAIKTFAGNVDIIGNTIIYERNNTENKSCISVFNGESINIENNFIQAYGVLDSAKVIEVYACKNVTIDKLSCTIKETSLLENHFGIENSESIILKNINFKANNTSQDTTDVNYKGLFRLAKSSYVTISDSNFYTNKHIFGIVATGGLAMLNALIINNSSIRVDSLNKELIHINVLSGDISFKNVELIGNSEKEAILIAQTGNININKSVINCKRLVSYLSDSGTLIINDVSLQLLQVGGGTFNIKNIHLIGSTNSYDGISIDTGTGNGVINGIYKQGTYRSIIKLYTIGSNPEVGYSSNLLVTNVSFDETINNGKFLLNDKRKEYVTFNNIGSPIGGISVGLVANKPNVLIGNKYFAQDLNNGNGKPIWYNGTTWVDATGTAV